MPPAVHELFWEKTFPRPDGSMTVTFRCRPGRREGCEAPHTRIAAPALLVHAAGWWAVEDRSYDDAAVDLLVVQVRAVRAISRSLPEPAAPAALARADALGRPEQFANGRRAVLHRVAALPGQVAQLPAQRVVTAQPPRTENVADIRGEAADFG